MQTLDFTLKGIAIEGTIIDVETVSLSPKPNGIFTFGTLSGANIHIVQAENESDCASLSDEIRRVWCELPRPIYAYNREFVGGWIADAIGGEARIDYDTMDSWKAVADQQSLKWPRLRELIRPPAFYYRWGIADYDRERDFGTMRRTMRGAKSVNEVISREALGGAPHVWWRQHLAMLQDPEIFRQLANPPEDPENTDADDRTSRIYRLPNGAWTTNRLAAIVCHNTLDLQSQASLLLWQWNITSAWL